MHLISQGHSERKKKSGENNRNREFILNLAILRVRQRDYPHAIYKTCKVTISRKAFHFSQNSTYREMINLRTNVRKD